MRRQVLSGPLRVPPGWDEVMGWRIGPGLRDNPASADDEHGGPEGVSIDPGCSPSRRVEGVRRRAGPRRSAAEVAGLRVAE